MTKKEKEAELEKARTELEAIKARIETLEKTQTADDKKLFAKYVEKYEHKFVKCDDGSDLNVTYIKKVKGFDAESNSLACSTISFSMDDTPDYDTIMTCANDDVYLWEVELVTKERAIEAIERYKTRRCKKLNEMIEKITSL